MDLQEAKVQLDDEGFCVLEGQIDAHEADYLNRRSCDLMESTLDQGTYLSLEGSLDLIPELAPICIHPSILELAEAALGENFILANNVAMKLCKPGAGLGGLHVDWPLPSIPKPWPISPTGLAAFWMLTDFTAKNGATAVIPFSHHTRRDPTSNRTYQHEVPVVGKKGSVLVFVNGIWHRSGANTTQNENRMAASVFYVPSFIYRPRDGWPIMKRHIYDKFPRRLQELLARSVEE